MSLNRTQCPHCFTTYLISEEQYRVSDGMVRCGTCRERFQARIIASPDTPKFDPRKAFIEPISEEKIVPPVNLSKGPSEIELAEPQHTEEPDHTDMSFSELEGSINSELSIDFDDDAPITAENADHLDAEAVLANIRARAQQQAANDAESQEPATLTAAEQQELALTEASEVSNTDDATLNHAEINIEPKNETQAVTEPISIQEPATQVTPEATIDDALIDEVSELIDNKLLGTNGTDSVEPKVDTPIVDTEFNLNPQAPRKASRWLLIPVVILLISAFGLTLVYQLWMKQLIVFPENSRAEQLIQANTTLVADQLAERNIELPVRRNLSKLELLSARTEAHPTRASTNLLRVNLINRADIAQPLPWLELSLTDSEGRLVSRRQLAPRDYIYNNKTQAQIGPKELKKITIELLAFPKQATGYELKLLSK